jgi:tetratricopeptide (TPR) repeat protein
MIGDAEQEERVRAALIGAVSVDIPVVRVGSAWYAPQDRFEVEPNDEISIDVVIRNVGVGHHFPGGVRDAQYTRVELEVTSADVSLRSAAEADEVHFLRALAADRSGALLFERQTHEFAAVVADHTIAPRDARVIRYRGRAPTGMRGRVRLLARVVHQSRNPQLQKASCVHHRSKRGQRFASAAPRAIDPCTKMPETLIAEVTRDSGVASAANAAQRLYHHGNALLHEVQEHLGEAEASYAAALALAGEDAVLRDRIVIGMAEVASRTGRVERALRLTDEVAPRWPKAAVWARIRGDALARVWRWPKAAEAYREAARRAPGNASLWRKLAVAEGSAGRDREALEAAQRGLRLLPRDADCLRVQALSLRDLGAAPQVVEAAMKAYDEYRTPDELGEIRRRCAAGSRHCAREVVPVHEHRLERAESREPRAENREPRTESREPRTDDRRPRTDDR